VLPTTTVGPSRAEVNPRGSALLIQATCRHRGPRRARVETLASLVYAPLKAFDFLLGACARIKKSVHCLNHERFEIVAAHFGKDRPNVFRLAFYRRVAEQEQLLADLPVLCHGEIVRSASLRRATGLAARVIRYALLIHATYLGRNN
jgi:hypothetical protein